MCLCHHGDLKKQSHESPFKIIHLFVTVLYKCWQNSPLLRIIFYTLFSTPKQRAQQVFFTCVLYVQHLEEVACSTCSSPYTCVTRPQTRAPVSCHAQPWAKNPSISERLDTSTQQSSKFCSPLLAHFDIFLGVKKLWKSPTLYVKLGEGGGGLFFLLENLRGQLCLNEIDSTINMYFWCQLLLVLI